MPEHYSDPNSDDMLMNNLITNYALEERNSDGTPSGRFYLDEGQAKKASEEMVKSHLHLSGDKLASYMNENFIEAWMHYNSANDGKIEVERMGTFFKYLLHDASFGG